jgi:hypothetical protein
MAVRRSATSKALRHLAPVIGAAPSVWRALEETGDLQLRRINTVVVEFRGHRDSGEFLIQVASGQDWAPLAVMARLLTPDEAALYSDLIEDTFAPRFGWSRNASPIPPSNEPYAAWSDQEQNQIIPWYRRYRTRSLPCGFPVAPIRRW